MARKHQATLRTLEGIPGLSELQMPADALAQLVLSGGVVYVVAHEEKAVAVSNFSPMQPARKKYMGFSAAEKSEEVIEALNRAIGDQFESEQDEQGGLVKIEASQPVNSVIGLDEIGFRVIGFKEKDLWMNDQLVDTLIGEVLNPMLWADAHEPEPEEGDDIGEEVGGEEFQEAEREENVGCL